MQNSQDLLRDYIDSILKLREEEGILSDLFDDDIIFKKSHLKTKWL